MTVIHRGLKNIRQNHTINRWDYRFILLHLLSSVPLPPRLRGQSRRTETYTEERTQSAESSVTQGLDQRLASTLELRTHLHHAINNTIDELALQNTMKSRLQVRTQRSLCVSSFGECLII